MVEQASKSTKKLKPPETKKKKKKKQQTTEPPPESPSYRLALKSLFSCRNSHGHPSDDNRSSKIKKPQQLSAPPSICKQVTNNNHKDGEEKKKKPPPPPPTDAKRRASVSGSSERCVKKPLKLQGSSSSSFSTGGGGGGGGSSFRGGMQLRRLSGCYECHMVVDPIFRDSSSSMRAAAICPCPDCGEIFVRQESLQLHQSIRHAVSELGADDTSRNIIEIIFQSSWLKKQSPVCRIERILKVHNTATTLARFEEYRDAVKAKAASSDKKQQQQQKKKKKKKHPRCTADGNELLRFHCATLGCSLGLNGATHLCGDCTTCAIIRDGFITNASDTATTSNRSGGIRTMATSGRAHDAMAEDDQECSSRAMLVCRVIAGRVKRPSPATTNADEEEADEEEEEEEYESVAGSAGVYSNMEELQVFNPKAILPCFVVIYKTA